VQVRADMAGLVAQDVAQPLPNGAASASPGADPARLSAVRAAAPEARVVTGARSAEWLVEGAPTDRTVLAAARAARPAVPTRLAPGLAGRQGDVAGCLAAADRARHRLDRPTRLAERAVGRADADTSATAAIDALLLVGRIVDQAVGTQRFAVLVADRGLADRVAAGTGLGSRLGHAIAAEPLPADGPVQVDDPPAARAGRVADRVRSSVAELVDQPQHRGDRGFGAGSGEQVGSVLQHPGQTLALPGAGNGRGHRLGDLSRPGFVGGSQPCEGRSHASTEEVPGRGP
jgi:hypothetical protein